MLPKLRLEPNLDFRPFTRLNAQSWVNRSIGYRLPTNVLPTAVYLQVLALRCTKRRQVH